MGYFVYTDITELFTLKALLEILKIISKIRKPQFSSVFSKIPSHIRYRTVISSKLGVNKIRRVNHISKVIFLVTQKNGIKTWIFNVWQGFH